MRWSGIVVAFVTAFVLVAWFLFLWKSSTLTADALQKEIDALDGAKNKC